MIPFYSSALAVFFGVECWCDGYAEFSSSLAAGGNVQSSSHLPFLRVDVVANVDGRAI